MTLELFKAPRKLVDDLSACGLRHVGYGVPPELCAPVVCAYVEVVRQASIDGGRETCAESLVLHPHRHMGGRVMLVGSS